MINCILFKHLEPYQFDRIFYFKMPWEVKLTLHFLILKLFISYSLTVHQAHNDYSYVISWNI